jgi:ubiquinone/menaquinone biosynthesis C-methylase UbiE
MPASRIEQPADLDTVRTWYDRVADKYVELHLGDITTYPWLRTAIDGFAAAVHELGPVLDVGCGPGDVTAYLAERGLDVSGVDLSTRMIEHARRLHPDQQFAVASATELQLAESSYGGVPVKWTTYLWQPDALWTLLTAAGFSPVADLRLSESVAGVPSLVLAARA